MRVQRRKSLCLLRVEGAHGGGSGITKEVSLLPGGVKNQEKRAAGRKAYKEKAWGSKLKQSQKIKIINFV